MCYLTSLTIIPHGSTASLGAVKTLKNESLHIFPTGLPATHLTIFHLATGLSSLKCKSHCIHLQPPCFYQWSTFFMVKVIFFSHDRSGSSCRGQLYLSSALAMQNYLQLLNSSSSAWKPDSLFLLFLAPELQLAFKGAPLLWEEHLEKEAPLRRQPGSTQGLTADG